MVHVYNLLHKSRINFILFILYIKKHHHMSGQHPVNLYTNPGIFFVTVSVVYEYRIEAGQFSAKILVPPKNIPTNCLIVISCTFRHGEQHIKNWRETERGKVTKNPRF